MISRQLEKMSNKFNSALDQLFKCFALKNILLEEITQFQSGIFLLVTLSAIHHTTKIYYTGSCKIQQTCYTTSQSPVRM